MRGDHKDSERTDRHSSRVASAASPVQKSPNTPTPAAQPVQNSPNTPKIAHFSPFCPSRENFVPLAPPRPPAGRTLYRSHHHAPQQGELCTAPSAKPGTKLSQHTQKGPFQPVLPQQGELCTARTTTPPSRENFVPHLAPNPAQNSPSTPVLQRFREKVRPAHPTPQQNREKVRPAHLKTAFFASFAPAGRILSRTSKQQATQGELFRALGIEQEVLTKVVCAEI